MAKPLTVLNIWGIPEIPVSDPTGTVLPRKKDAILYSEPQVPSATTTPVAPFSKPIGLQIPADVSQPVTLKVPLKVEISANFSKDWDGPALLKLIGTLLDKDDKPIDDVLVSDEWPYTISDQTRYLKSHTWDQFTLKQKVTCVAPFAISGNVMWRLERTIPGPRFPPDAEAPKIRLDLFWLNIIAPSGPLIAVSNMSDSAMDMQAVYPANVLGFYLPNPVKVSGFDTQNVRIQWLQHIMSLVTPVALAGRYYNLVSGMSGYSVGCCGGGFDFAAWLKGRSQMLNSSDLSAVIQIGIGLLLYRNAREGELSRSRWVCKYPHGKIPASNPFGWGDDEEYHYDVTKGANNPYFVGNGKAALLETAPTDLRPAIMSRPWIEGQFGPPADVTNRVADTSFFLPPDVDGAEVGTRDRGAYGARHIVLQSQMELVSYSGNPSNQCYLNNFFPRLPDGSYPRIGVWNLKGIPAFTVTQEPTANSSEVLDFLKLPPGLRASLELLVARCKRVSAELAGTELFNDASLLPVDILSGWVTPDKMKTADTEVVLSRFLSVARYSSQSQKGNNFILEIHTHTSQRNALEGLLLELSRFECDLTSTADGAPTVTVPADGFGDYLAQHPHGFLYILGNVLISLTLLNAPPAKDSIADLRFGLSNIHNRLFLKRCRRSQIRRPVMALKDVPTTVTENTAFTVSFAQAGLLTGYLDAQISDCPLLYLSKTAMDGTNVKTMEFSALDYTEDYGSTKPTVHVLGAHAATYYPGEVSFPVQIKKA